MPESRRVNKRLKPKVKTSATHAQSAHATWVWLKIKQEGLRRCWSMFPLTRVPFWYRFFEPQPHGLQTSNLNSSFDQPTTSSKLQDLPFKIQTAQVAQKTSARPFAAGEIGGHPRDRRSSEMLARDSAMARCARPRVSLLRGSLALLGFSPPMA